MNKVKTCLVLLCALLCAEAYGQAKTLKDTINRKALLQQDSLLHTLGGVIISASKSVIEQKADRIVFNVENSPAAAGSDAYELLRRTPGVQVNNGSVTIPGKGGVSIMLNDKLLQVSGEELEAILRGMTAENIARIEVITTPPAKYDAAGDAGLINIVTKKAMRRGWSGNLGGNYAQNTNGGGMVAGGLNYRSSKLFLYATAFARKNEFVALMDNTTYYTQQQQDEHLRQVNSAGFNSVELGADYKMGRTATIGFTDVYRQRTRDVTQDYHTDVWQIQRGQKDSVLYTFAREPFKGHALTGSVDYDWKIDTQGRRLRISANYFSKGSKIERTFNTHHEVADGAETGYATYNHIAADQSIDIKVITADWDMPQKWADVSVGVKGAFIANSKDYVANAIVADGFDYRENTGAAYISAARKWGKWQANMGLRTEYTQTIATSATTVQTYKNGYFKLFPTGYLQYDVSKSLALHINYSRRIERPGFDDLNPFKDYNTDVSYSTGNPYLQPYTSNNLEIGGMVNGMYNFRLYANHKKDFFASVSVIDSARQSYYFTTVNTGDCRNYGLLLSTVLSIGKAWQIMPQVNGYYSNLSSTYYDQTYRISTPSFNAEVNNIITLNKSKTLLAEFGARYQSAEQKELVLQHEYSVVWGGLKAQLLDRQLIAGFAFNDPFNTDYRRLENLYNHTFSVNHYDRRSFTISLTWRFGNKNIKKDDKEDKILSEAGRAG